MSRNCVGLIVKDRWNLTSKVLDSLFHVEQEKNYTFYIISNGSSAVTNQNLKKWVSSGFVPVKNLILTPEFSIPQIYNLFLLLAEDHENIVLMQNDLVLHGTPVSLVDTKPQAQKPSHMEPPMMLGVNPGAVPNLGATIGGGIHLKRRSNVPMSTCFLDLLEEYMRGHNLSMCSLPFLGPNQLPNWFLKHAAEKEYRNMPYINMGVTMLTNETISKLGYFDERLPRMVDVEYSQRALRNKMNIGYHDSYWTYDISGAVPTEGGPIADHKKQVAMGTLDGQGVVDYAPTVWEPLKRNIIKECKAHRVVNIST